MKIYYKNNDLIIENSDKVNVIYNFKDSSHINIDDFVINAQWEYEKSWVLVEVKLYKWLLFYKVTTDTYKIVIITDFKITLDEEILWFFGDIDILLLPWMKESAKLYDDLEAKIVIPFGEWKDVFFNAISQNIAEVDNYKISWVLNQDSTEFVNLKVW